MAEVEGTKFGSAKWFLAWGERLANAGLGVLTNTITAGKTAAAPPSDTAKSSGGFAKSLAGLPAWLAYAAVGAAVLILVLVFRKK